MAGRDDSRTGLRPSRGLWLARCREAARHARLPLRLSLALLPIVVVGAGLVTGWRGALGAALGVALIGLVFAGGGVTVAFAGRGSTGRLLAVTLAGLLARLLAAAGALWLGFETGVTDGHAVAVAAALALVVTLGGYARDVRGNREVASRSSRTGKGVGR